MLRHKICKNNQPFEQILLTDNIIYVRFRNCFYWEYQELCLCCSLTFYRSVIFCVFIFVSYQKQEPSDLLRLITITLSAWCVLRQVMFLWQECIFVYHYIMLLTILMTNYCNSYISYKLLNICQNDRLVK